jgi:undecaprenyl-diphosphatase
MDTSAFEAVNRFAHRTGWLHSVAVAMAKDGIVLFAAALAVGWWLGRRRDEAATVAAAVCAGAAVLVALGAGQVIGHLVDRARPYDAIVGVHVLVSRSRDFSFPSDHSTAAGAVAAGLWFADRRLARATAVLAVLMAAARVYVGAHYPGDVLAGLLLGGAVAVGVHRVASGTVERLLEHLAGTPVGVVIRRTASPARRA